MSDKYDMEKVAQKALDKLIQLRQVPINTLEDWRALLHADQRISQLIDNTRISPKLRKRMLEVLREVESYMQAHPMLEIANPAAYAYYKGKLS